MAGASTGFRSSQVGSKGYEDHDIHLKGVQVALAPNMDKEDYMSGRVRPTLITAEPPMTVSIIINSKDQQPGSQSNFNIFSKIDAPLFRARIAQVVKVVLPKINNLTPLNNTLFFRHSVGGWATLYHTVFQTGLYSTTELANAMAFGMNDAVTAGAFDATSDFTCEFNDTEQTFTLSAGGGETFYLISTSSFIVRGANLALFPATPDLGSGVAPALPLQTITSTRAAMLYTSVVTVHSAALNQFAYAQSRTSNPLQGSAIIAYLDNSSSYNPGDFDVGVPFSGNYTTIMTPGAPRINVNNPQKQLIQFIDISLNDEYGFNLSLAVGNQVQGSEGSGGGIQLPTFNDEAIGFALEIQASF